MHRSLDILDALLAEILEDEGQSLAERRAHRLRHADAARLRQRFQARRDIDAVAVDVLAIDDDLAEVHTDAEHDPVRLRQRRVARGELGLHARGAGQRVARRGELGEDGVAGVMHDVAAVTADLPSKEVQAQAEPAVGAFLVRTGQTAVAGDVRIQNGDQLAGELGFGGHAEHTRRGGPFAANPSLLDAEATPK